jgi:hypothetical protein
MQLARCARRFGDGALVSLPKETLIYWLPGRRHNPAMR